MTGDLLSDAQAWLGLAIALVLVASAGPGPAAFVRYSLLAVILYVLLLNADRIRPAVARFNASLPLDGATLTPAPASGGSAGRKRT